jgi:leucyl aminopeptidase (aminopeptidase T)
MPHPTRHLVPILAALFAIPTTGFAQSPDLQAVARNLVQAASVKSGDRVFISGSVRDAHLMEHLAIETMKAGGQPLMVLQSESVQRRSYDEVPVSYDTLTRTLNMSLINAFNVQIVLDVGEAEDLMAGVPEGRRSTRNKSFQPVTDAYFKSRNRSVNLGNDLYPTATLSSRLGMPRVQVASAFWAAAAVPPATLRAKGDALRATFANGRQVTLTHPNGTNLTFGVDAARGFTSDGVVKDGQGGAGGQTWLPAGELIVPATPGTADGKVVIDKMIWDGKVIERLTLNYSRGRLTSMTAGSDIAGLRAFYDRAGAGKDQFAYIDIGLNPESKFPVGTGRIVWTVPGSIVVGLGDNRAFGGTNASDFGLAGQLGGATLKVDGRVVIENGQLK